MALNLLKNCWMDIDSAELRILLGKHFRGPGQYDDRSKNPNTLHLPLAGTTCRINITYREKKIVSIEKGRAFDPAEWERVSEDIENSIIAGPTKVGREYSFSSFRVSGFWRGQKSGVQILPPPDDAPRAHLENEDAEHPFILEFPMKSSSLWAITNHRRMQEHRNLTLLLNVLLIGHFSLQLRRREHFWASVPYEGDHKNVWVPQFFFAKLGEAVIDELSPPSCVKVEELEPEEYYANVGHDGKGLRLPSNLDQSICRYFQLSPINRTKFDRAAFWLDMASR